MVEPLHRSVRPGSEKARIWAICDALYAERGIAPSGREVVDRYAAQGGNEGTGFSQFSHWKKALERRLGAGAGAGLNEAAMDFAPAPSQGALLVAADGSLVLPGQLVKPLGLKPGDAVSARIEDGELRLSGYEQVVRRIQRRMARYKKPGQSVVDEFLIERRGMWGEE